MRPLHDLLLVEEVIEERTHSGLVLVTNQKASTNTQQGRVLAIGPDVSEKLADTIVVFGAYAGTVVVEGKQPTADQPGSPSQTLVREQDLLAVIE